MRNIIFIATVFYILPALSNDSTTVKVIICGKFKYSEKYAFCFSDNRCKDLGVKSGIGFYEFNIPEKRIYGFDSAFFLKRIKIARSKSFGKLNYVPIFFQVRDSLTKDTFYFAHSPNGTLNLNISILNLELLSKKKSRSIYNYSLGYLIEDSVVVTGIDNNKVLFLQKKNIKGNLIFIANWIDETEYDNIFARNLKLFHFFDKRLVK